ncbi:unnamed protein product [Macrosiphum euphorbiae]|uniref:Uncharacterized protein n=1 Tax=Macrosiphum euphorbiae TaxID=13131 RepID=A0AAV0VRW4_9HEMI|nr:unnamed protein product [Macrosiphum euphorbiae]
MNGHLKTTPPVPPLVPSKVVLPVTVVPPFAHIRYKEKSRANTCAEATSNNSNNEPISNILSQFVTQLNSLISPLISLLSKILSPLLSKNTVSP